jgi:hypothetical protein
MRRFGEAPFGVWHGLAFKAIELTNEERKKAYKKGE